MVARKRGAPDADKLHVSQRVVQHLELKRRSFLDARLESTARDREPAGRAESEDRYERLLGALECFVSLLLDRARHGEIVLDAASLRADLSACEAGAKALCADVGGGVGIGVGSSRMGAWKDVDGSLAEELMLFVHAALEFATGDAAGGGGAWGRFLETSAAIEQLERASRQAQAHATGTEHSVYSPRDFEAQPRVDAAATPESSLQPGLRRFQLEVSSLGVHHARALERSTRRASRPAACCLPLSCALP